MRSLSIFGKLLVYQSAPILLTVLFLGWLVYDHTRDALLRQQRHQAALETHHMIDAVEARSRVVERVVREIVDAPAFRDLDSNDAAAALRAVFERHAETLPRAALVDAEHHEVYVYAHGRDPPAARQLLGDPLLQEAFSHPNRVRWGIAASGGGEPGLRLAFVRSDPSGNFVGALHATVAIDVMLGDVVEQFAEGETSGAVFLAAGQPVLTSPHMLPEEAATIGRWLTDGRVSAKSMPESETFARLTADGIDTYVSVAAATARPWVAVVSTPYDRFIAPIDALLMRIAIIAGLVLLVATALAWVAAGRMARPLRQLGAAARQLAAGDYDAAVPVRSEDEFGMLARSFNEMSKSLRTAHGDLAREVEERRRTETRLETTEAQFRAVFDNSPICLNLKDTDGRYLLLNKGDEEWLGLPASEILGRTADEFMEPDREDLHGLHELEAEVLRTRQPAQRELEVHRGGHVHHRLLIKFPVTSDNGKVIRIGTAAVDITERKDAEAAIRRNEMRFRSAVENLAIGFAYFDADDRLVAANAEWLSHYALPPETRPEGLFYEELLRRIVAHGRMDLEIGGTEREGWIRDRVVAHRNPSGEPLLRHYADDTWALVRENRTPDGGIIQTRTDVTALRQAEQKLTESEARFKALFDNLPIGLIVKDSEQRIVMMNPNFQRRWQRRAEDYLGKPYASLFPEEGDGRATAEEELAAFAEGRTLIVERQRRTPDGELRTILIHKFPIYGDDGALAAIGSAGVDLTELRLAQQEASQAERLLYEAVESLPLAFALFDADERLVLANEYVKRDTAWNPELVVPGVTYEALLRDCVARGMPLNAAEDPDNWVAERLERHRSGEGGTENRLPDGRVMHAITRKTSNGGRITLRHDITDRKRAEEALKRHLEQLEELVDARTRHLVQEIAERRQAEKSLRELNETLEERVEQRTHELQMEKVRAELASRAKTDFLQHMSHELRTPLNAVIGFSDMIRQEIMGPVGHAVYLGYARDIYESGSYLLSLINDILDIARIEEGVLEVDEEVLDLGALVAACCKVVEGRAHEKRLTIETKLLPDTPGLLADERRVKQILINLLFNAIKFTPEGGRVTLAAEPATAGGLALTVADTGVGISPDDLERVMEPFGRVENSLSTTAQGTGLGLPICRALIEAHDGQLELESVVGQGTTVRAVFPAERVIAAETATR